MKPFALFRPSNRRWRAGLLAALLLLGAAGAQYTSSALKLGGQTTQASVIGAAEYVLQSALEAVGGGNVLRVSREDPNVRIMGLGHTLLLPIDELPERAALATNTVQLDGVQVQGRIATLINGELYLPLDTLARGLGADYKTGNFALPAPALISVASRAGQNADRIVLDLSRDVPYSAALSGDTLTLTLRGTAATPRSYVTRGAFVPKFAVNPGSGNAVIRLPLGAGSGYRLFKVVRPGSVRLVLDVGPNLPRSVSVLSESPRAPLIVLDPAPSGGSKVDVPLEVARAAAARLSQAGWQVKLTRTAAGRLPIAERERLARQSQVFVTLSLGRFPGAKRSGITLYQPSGEQNARIINAYREADQEPLVRAAVGNGGETKRLSELLLGELGTRGLKAVTVPMPRLYLPGEAPHAAFELELGWPQSQADEAALLEPQRSDQVSEALALSVATFLRARAANLSGGGT